jgi:U3 small nucleolar RNA-associated protein 14
MPGWGDWAGAGIELNGKSNRKKSNKSNRNRKQRKPLIIKPEDVAQTKEEKKELIRRDKNLAHVIISEKKDTKISQFQVNFYYL